LLIFSSCFFETAAILASNFFTASWAAYSSSRPSFFAAS
jgi:hypothetical protein